jgi:polysaccharide export outer membrane protein
MFDDRKFGAGFVGSVLLSAFALTGCADTRGGSIPYGRQLVAPDEQRFQTLAEDYKIAPMDTLTIKVFKADDLSGDYSVDLAGHVSLPLVGQVEAANLTTDQLREKLTKLLGQSYFEHPDVSVAIKQSTAHVVTVDGAVSQPGQYPVATSLSLMQVVALAHGTSGDANARRVAVFRTIDGRRQAAAFDLTSIRRGQAKDPSIYAGDIVVVDGSKIKAVEKQIVQAVPLLYVFLPVL